jgi:hypothetical protein
MDPRETYAWVLFIGLMLALFGLCLYLFFMAEIANSKDLPEWVGGSFDHRPDSELVLYRWLAVGGAVITGGTALIGVLGAFLRGKQLIR